MRNISTALTSAYGFSNGRVRCQRMVPCSCCDAMSQGTADTCTSTCTPGACVLSQSAVGCSFDLQQLQQAMPLIPYTTCMYNLGSGRTKGLVQAAQWWHTRGHWPLEALYKNLSRSSFASSLAWLLHARAESMHCAHAHGILHSESRERTVASLPGVRFGRAEKMQP